MAARRRGPPLCTQRGAPPARSRPPAAGEADPSGGRVYPGPPGAPGCRAPPAAGRRRQGDWAGRLALQIEQVGLDSVDARPTNVGSIDGEDVGAEGAAGDRMQDRKVADVPRRWRWRHGRIPGEPRPDTAA